MTDTRRDVFAAILAAGSSTRFGSTKQVAELGGTPLVRRATAAAQQVCGENVVTVIGHDMARVLAVLGDDSGFVVVNDDHATGLASSIVRAVNACRSDAAALFVLMADQALVTAGHLQCLLEEWSGSDNEIVATAYDGTAGPPVLFASGTFADLTALQGDTGARALFDDKRFDLKTVPFEPASVDIDTPADLAALT